MPRRKGQTHGMMDIACLARPAVVQAFPPPLTSSARRGPKRRQPRWALRKNSVLGAKRPKSERFAPVDIATLGTLRMGPRWLGSPDTSPREALRPVGGCIRSDQQDPQVHRQAV